MCSCWALAVLSLAPLSYAARSNHGRTQEAIVPPLDPKSDKRFFRKDYPDDFRPKPSADHLKKFDHPYPTVQDHETFDKDFIKDENNDGGEWKAQTEYDRLRSKLQRLEHELKQAHEHEQEEAEKAKALEKEEKSVHEEAEKAEKAAKNGRKSVNEAEERLKNLTNKKEAAKTGIDGDSKVDDELNEAIKETKKKMHDLEDCQKRLADAQAKLKVLMKEKMEYDKDHASSREARVTALGNLTAEAKRELADALASKSNLTAAKKALQKRDAALKKDIAEAEAEHEASLKAYMKEKADAEAAEARVDKAAEKLRQYRSQVDSDGGVTRTQEPKKNGAERTGRAVWLAGALLLPVLTQA